MSLSSFNLKSEIKNELTTIKERKQQQQGGEDSHVFCKVLAL